MIIHAACMTDDDRLVDRDSAGRLVSATEFLLSRYSAYNSIVCPPPQVLPVKKGCNAEIE